MTLDSVWDVYDLLRTARLNVKYYSSILIRYTQMILFFEIVLALSASSAVVVAVTFLDAPFGKVVWLLLSCLTAIIALINPILNLGGNARAIEKALFDSQILSFELTELTYNIKLKNEYSGEDKKRFQEILKRREKIVMEEPQLRVDKKLLKRKTEEVLKEMPVDAFFVPEN